MLGTMLGSEVSGDVSKGRLHSSFQRMLLQLLGKLMILFCSPCCTDFGLSWWK